MNPLRLAAGALLLAVCQLGAAVQPAAVPAPTRSGPAAGEPIERGGTIEGVDAARPAIVVDGVAYLVPRGSVKIHLAGQRVTGAVSELKRGMQIRFTALPPSGSQPGQVREIWVTGMRTR